MENVKYFTPNTETHREFAEALKKAQKNGVNICCVDCLVSTNELKIKDFVDVVL